MADNEKAVRHTESDRRNREEIPSDALTHLDTNNLDTSLVRVYEQCIAGRTKKQKPT
jgi:hypothetical protein